MMDLLLHDIAVAIERDASPGPTGRWAWNTMMRPAEDAVEPHSEPRRDQSTTTGTNR